MAMPSLAQGIPAVDLSAGYSFFHLGGSTSVNMNGFDANATFNANHWLGLVADLGTYHGSPDSVGLTATTYTFGPRLSLPTVSAFTPFAQALFGGAHVSASYGGFGGSSNPFTYGAGGGVEIGRGRIALRPEVEYLALRSNSVSSNSVRVSVGLAFRMGQK